MLPATSHFLRLTSSEPPLQTACSAVQLQLVASLINSCAVICSHFCSRSTLSSSALVVNPSAFATAAKTTGRSGNIYGETMTAAVLIRTAVAGQTCKLLPALVPQMTWLLRLIENGRADKLTVWCLNSTSQLITCPMHY